MTNEPNNQQVITIGRDSKNTLVLNETNISSFHARLTISAGQIVLEDLGSTNGTSVGTVENKIHRTTVKPDDRIFFGSKEYSLAELVASEQPQGQPTVENASKSVSMSWVSSPMMRYCLAGFAGLMLLIVVGLGLFNRNPSPPQSAKTNATNSSETTGSSVGNSITGSNIAAKSNTSDESEKPDKLISQEERLARSLFVIVCSDKERKTPFRIGSAFAIDSQHLATSASVIQAMQNLNENGFPLTFVYCPFSENEFDIKSTRIHPEYENANSQSRNAQQQHDEILDELNSNPPDEKSFESIKQKLLTARAKAMDGLELKTTCDAAIIEVEQPLSHWLSGVAADASLRPKLKLNVAGYAFDLEDPFFDMDAPMEVSTMQSRIQRISNWSADSPTRLVGDGTPIQLEESFLGSPVLNGQGQVIAVYSRPVPPKDNSDQTPPSSSFDAALFSRVNECGLDRP